ncbi:ABC transporter ATP-binding protein [Hymenobacter sp. ASUV-10]|uniref:ABC transporter ATP-binding protein n=1 Tax=Hymenobacter aranciens TaxID=3063996 RepID=A0ABT9B7P6_9BACT|nr:ABC transporter ATP-binding protein [Hymenobacter sp. ASUV-10]MDO7874218.1 ABC transporter ATP-binding protein [Hymenobacter sp. ASUV-10]
MSIANAEILTVTDLTYTEHGATILHPLSFSQREGQKLAVAGESGTGKSTLLQLISGLIQPTSGEITANGRRVRGPAHTLVPGHPGVAYLSQKSDLPHSLRVEQVLRYANKRPAAEAQAVYELCRIVPLMARRTDQLSGGEQQRVALARLLLGTPRLLLLDEPFSNLDRGHKRIMQLIIADVGTRLGITCLLVSHDAADTLSWADEILVLHRGRIVQQGPPETIYQQPASEYVAGLFGDYDLVSGPDREALRPSASGQGASLLLRPEQLTIAPAGSPGAPGTVRAIRYFGSYYEVEIQLAEIIIRARSATRTVAPGNEVAVVLGPTGGWELP